MKTCNTIVNGLLFVEDLSYALHSQRRYRRILARIAVGVMIMAIVVFYSSLVKVHISFAALMLNMIADTGVSMLAFIVLLLLPVETALGRRDIRSIILHSDMSWCSLSSVQTNDSAITSDPAGKSPLIQNKTSLTFAFKPDESESTELETECSPNDDIGMSIDLAYGSINAGEADEAEKPHSLSPIFDDIENAIKIHKTSSQGLDARFGRTTFRATLLPAIDISSKDIGMTLHAYAFVFCVVSSCICENVVVFTDRYPEVKIHEAVLFFFANIIQNMLYCGGFFQLGISYRILACRIWRCREELIDASSLSGNEDIPTTLFQLVSRHRSEYEATYKDSEKLSARTGIVAMMLVELIMVEMVSVLVHGNFEEYKWDLSHIASTRHLLVLSCLLLQVALASADIMYASRRLAASMANLEGKLREDIGKSIFYGVEYSFDLKRIQILADLLKTVGYRVANFPVRIAVSWFKFTTDWVK